MNATKAVFFYIFLIIAIINTILMYLGAPITNYTTIGMVLVTLTALLFSGLLTTIALASHRRITLKTSFQLQLLILLILVITSIISRISELLTMTIDASLIWRIGATLLYFILLLFTIGLSRDVFKKLLEIRNKTISNNN